MPGSDAAGFCREWQERVDTALQEYLPHPDVLASSLVQAMRYSLESRAKRFRPLLLLGTMSSLGAPPENGLPTACAIEMIHTYSLIHDDLPAIDDDPVRRGKPSSHVAFGEDMAILAGDALFAEALHLIAARQGAAEPSRVLAVLKEVSAASGVDGMVGGQVVDIRSTGHHISGETLHFIHRNKTGRLIRASVVCGAILASADDKTADGLAGYADHLGLGFQIADDILDVCGEEAVIGKPVGSDESAEKTTFPSLYGTERSAAMVQREYNLALEALAMTGLEDDGILRHLAHMACFRDR